MQKPAEVVYTNFEPTTRVCFDLELYTHIPPPVKYTVDIANTPPSLALYISQWLSVVLR